jgi:N-acetylneuraminate synthase
LNNVIIIAEAGVNHNGDIAIAKKLIESAATAGADYVKFQTFIAANLVSTNAKKADYQEASSSISNESQGDMLKRLELSKEDHLILIQHCKDNGIKFLSTAFDAESLQLLGGFRLDVYKIPSGEITNLPYLRSVAQLGLPIIISTGMSTLGEVKDAIRVLNKGGVKTDNITVLHCNTEYPTPMEDVNLNAMNTIAEECNVKVGYSDHTLGIEVPIAAVAMGAICIEKHFTLDRNMEGPDHKASLEPEELKAMVTGIRNVEIALGSKVKEPSPSEEKNISIARKSIFTSKSLSAGHILTLDDLIMKRPGDGISPMEIDSILGKTTTKPLPFETKLSNQDLI